MFIFLILCSLVFIYIFVGSRFKNVFWANTVHRASQHVPIWWPTSRESLAKISWLMVEVAKPKKLKIHQSFSVESGMIYNGGKSNLGEGMWRSRWGCGCCCCCCYCCCCCCCFLGQVTNQERSKGCDSKESKLCPRKNLSSWNGRTLGIIKIHFWFTSWGIFTYDVLVKPSDSSETVEVIPCVAWSGFSGRKVRWKGKKPKENYPRRFKRNKNWEWGERSCFLIIWRNFSWVMIYIDLYVGEV